MRTKLSNAYVSIEVDSHGAELCSIRFAGQEYLWQADPAFWNRHSPVLFPIVGRVWDNVYRVDGQEFALGQHGFARDMEFEFLGREGNEIWYRLESSQQTLEKFPFKFVLEIGYRLTDRKIDVMWRVRNIDGKRMIFQIGAHPAFIYPAFNSEDEIHGYFHFGRVKEFDYILVKEKGCADTQNRQRITLSDGYLPLDQHIFDFDALIVEHGQLNEVTLCRPDRKPWLTMSFDAPVVGLWSPPGKNAPFVCIEPWYGRCDRVGFAGEFEDKDWMNFLEPGASWERAYSIEV